MNFTFGGPAFADVALWCLLRCGFALVLQALVSVPFHNAFVVVVVVVVVVVFVVLCVCVV